MENGFHHIHDLPGKYPVGLFEIALDEELTLLWVNSHFYSLTGYTAEQFEEKKGCNLRRIIHPDDYEKVITAANLAITKKEAVFESEARMIRQDKSIIWILIRGNIFIENEKFRLYCVGLNITLRKEIELEMRLSEERFRIALSNTSNLIFDYDPETKEAKNLVESDIIFCLPQKLENMPEYLIEKGIIQSESIDDYLEVFNKVLSGGAFASAVLRTTRLGMETWIRLSLTNVFDQNRKSIRLIGFISDITKEINAEIAFKRELQYRKAFLADAVAYYEINLSADVIEKYNGEWIKRFTGKIRRVIRRYLIWYPTQQSIRMTGNYIKKLSTG